MIAAIKAEFRKLLTIRTTYCWFAIALALCVALIGYWIYGFKDVEHAAMNSGALASSMFAAVSLTGIILSIVTVLAVGHEYRYNTIMYSLTSSNSRAKVFFAKLLTLAGFALVFAVVVVLLNAVFFYIGLKVQGVDATGQNVPVWDFLWRAAVTVLGNVTYAFIIAFILRSLIGAIVTVLVVPSTIESLLSLVLKDNTKFLPYTALGNLTESVSKIPFTTSLWVVVAYVVGGGLVAYLLFLKRDAN